MLTLSARLNIRPGENEAVTSPFERAGNEILETLHKIHRGDLRGAPDDIIEEKLVEMELSKAAFENAWAEFTVAAVKRVETAT